MRQLTVTYFEYHRFLRREARRTGVLGTRRTRQLVRFMQMSGPDSDQSGTKFSLQLESLILAQNERWRQA